jgi:large subunit ribosomal protein L6
VANYWGIFTRRCFTLVEIVLAVPEKISATLEGSVLKVEGPLGILKKDFSKVRAYIESSNNSIKLKSYGDRRKDRAVFGTASSLVENMFIGVTKGFTYKLKVVSAHFPISVRVKEGLIFIENFYGEKAPRIAKIVGSCKISIEGDDVIVQGISKEDAGQTAANMESATRVRKKDQRVFLDGVYVYEQS